MCGRAVMHDARPSLFIFAVLSAVLRSGFRDGTPVHCTIEVVEHFNNYVTRHYYALTGTLRFRTFSLRLLLTHAINSKDSIIKIQQHISPQKNYHVNKLARADTVCLITASDRK